MPVSLRNIYPFVSFSKGYSEFKPRVGATDMKLAKLGDAEKVIAPLKAENLAMTFKSRIESVDSTRSNSRSNSPFVNNTPQPKTLSDKR